MVTAIRSREIVILDPSVQPDIRERPLAPRPADRENGASLEGLRVGLLDNNKPNAGAFLDRVEAGLRARFRVAELVRRTKPHAGLPCPAPTLEEMAACDVVVSAFGD
jgi:hypothetical protein